ncbi:MAG: hypothetical protein K2L63_03985 [Paramuribaculum sp.]|nr:hypothetical protein [Paramuribaculum sp.]
MSLPLCCSVVAAADTYLKDKLIMSPTPLKIQLLTVAIAAIAATACSTTCHEELLVAEAMRQAGDNAGELRALLDRYDDGRRESAEYAVAATWGRQLFNIDLYDLNLNAQ